MVFTIDQVKTICKKAFPAYRGRKWRQSEAAHVNTSNSNWSGGTKYTYVFVRLDNGATMDDPNSGTAPWIRDWSNGGTSDAELIPGMVCVKHIICCGHDC